MGFVIKLSENMSKISINCCCCHRYWHFFR